MGTNWKLFRNAPCFEHLNCIPEKATCLDFFNRWNEHNNREKGWERHLVLPAKRQRELEHNACGKHCLTSQQPRRSPSLFQVPGLRWGSVPLAGATSAHQDESVPDWPDTALPKWPNPSHHWTPHSDKRRQILAPMRHRHCDGPKFDSQHARECIIQHMCLFHKVCPFRLALWFFLEEIHELQETFWCHEVLEMEDFVF